MMELNLHEPSGSYRPLYGQLGIADLSWWFWVKAGMGFTFGAGVMSVIAVMLYFALLATLGFAWLSLR